MHEYKSNVNETRNAVCASITISCNVCMCRVLYWTVYRMINPAIYRSSVVNPAPELLIQGGLVLPGALTIDFTGSLSSVVG